MITNQIKETKYYKNISKIKKLMVVKLPNVKKITHGINMSNNVGFEKWTESYHPSYDNQEIVKELLNKNPSTIK